MTQNVLWSRSSVCLSICLCVCLCVCPRPDTHTTAQNPDVTWGRGRGCPLVVHYWADLQSAHELRCYGNITRTLVYAGCARVADQWPAGDGGVLKHARRISQVGVARWPVTGRRRGAFSTLLRRAVARTAGSQWWRSGDITPNQNVSEYMAVGLLALCLVIIAIVAFTLGL